MDKPKAQELLMMHATLCQAIAEPTRIAILYELGDGPRHVNQLVETLDLPQATVSRHLKILRDRSLVNTERNGPYIHYEIADRRVLDALDIMRAVMANIVTQQNSLVETMLV